MIPKWVWALVIPVVCAIAFWKVLPPAYRASESTDYEMFYGPVAHRILAGSGITTESGAVAMRYPPGYPMITAAAIGIGGAVGLSEDHSMDALTLACIAVSSLLLFLIARDIWDWKLALLPSVGWSTYPLALWLTKQPNSEVPFTMLLFACALAASKLTRSAAPRPALVAALGALAGAAMLVRPIAILLPVVLAALAVLLGTEWTRRARAAVAAGILAASMLVVAPWEVHASRAAGKVVLLSTGGAPTMRDGLTFGVNESKGRAGIYVPDAIRTVMIAFLAQYDSLDSYGAVLDAGKKQFAQHPLGMTGLIGMKLMRAWYGTDSQRLDRYILWLQLVYLAMLGWAFQVCWHRGGERRRLAIIAGAIIVYFWGMSVAALPLVRYLVPAIGLAFLMLPGLVERRRLTGDRPAFR